MSTDPAERSPKSGNRFSDETARKDIELERQSDATASEDAPTTEKQLSQRPDLDRNTDPEKAPFPEDPRLRVMRRLVNALLVVMIAGVLSITVAILITLKQLRTPLAAGLSEQERIVAAEATAERISLVIENTETGARRVVLLDGRSFQPIAGIAER